MAAKTEKIYTLLSKIPKNVSSQVKEKPRLVNEE